MRLKVVEFDSIGVVYETDINRRDNDWIRIRQHYFKLNNSRFISLIVVEKRNDDIKIGQDWTFKYSSINSVSITSSQCKKIKENYKSEIELMNSDFYWESNKVNNEEEKYLIFFWTKLYDIIGNSELHLNMLELDEFVIQS